MDDLLLALDCDRKYVRPLNGDPGLDRIPG